MKRYTRNKDVSWRLDEDRQKRIAERLQKGDTTGNRAVVVLSLAGTLYDLDMVGADAWLSLEEPKNVDQITDAIIDRYDVSWEELAGGISELLKDMEQVGLVQSSD